MRRITTLNRKLWRKLTAEFSHINFRRYLIGIFVGVFLVFVGIGIANRNHPVIENFGRTSAPNNKISMSEGKFLSAHERTMMLAMQRDARLARALTYLKSGGFHGGVRVDMDACRVDWSFESGTHFDFRQQYINFCFQRMSDFRRALVDHGEEESADRVVEDAALFVLFHELGHAFFRDRNVPVLGSGEDAADEFASMVAIHVHAPELAVAGARFFELSSPSSDVTADDPHAPPAQRAYRVRCLAYGAAPQSYPDWIKDKKAGATCVDDFKIFDAGWLVMLHDAKARDVKQLSLLR